jgi:hypothetical protein
VDIAVLPLTERQAAWLRDQGRDFAATLRRILDEEIRQAILKRAIRDERDVELLIERRRKTLARANPKAQFSDVMHQAEDEILAACEAMSDLATRAAAERLGILYGAAGSGAGCPRRSSRLMFSGYGKTGQGAGSRPPGKLRHHRRASPLVRTDPCLLVSKGPVGRISVWFSGGLGARSPQ